MSKKPQCFVIGHKKKQPNTFFGHTLWEWADLLLVPAILALAALGFQWTQQNTATWLAEQARLDQTLDEYLVNMQALILKEDLLESKSGDPKRDLARTLTLTTIRRLDGERNRTVFQFLQEVGAMKKDDPVVSFVRADLSGTDLRGADLHGAGLSGANLTTALLGQANLTEADLSGADLEGADLTHAHLWAANLQGAAFWNATMPDGTSYNQNPDLLKFTDREVWEKEQRDRND